MLSVLTPRTTQPLLRTTSPNPRPKCNAKKYVTSINAGSHRSVALYHFDPVCTDETTMFHVAIALDLASIACCVSSVVYLMSNGLVAKQKFFQITYFFVITIVTNFGFLVLILTRSQMHVDRFGCILGYSIFLFSSMCFQFSLLSLTCDCFIAVFFPLQYRAVMTKKALIIPNAIVLITLFIIIVVYPIPAFSRIHKGYLWQHCSVDQVFSHNYMKILGIITFTINTVFIVLNVTIAFGVLRSLIKRNQISASEASLRKSMMKLSLRLIVIIFFNFGFTLPLSLEFFGIELFEESFSFALGVSLGLWNTLIFVAGDPEIRDRLCGRKNRPV